MRTLVAIAALVGTASADVGGTTPQSIQPGGKVAFTKSIANGRLCWTTGTTGSPATPVCPEVPSSSAATAVGNAGDTVTCSADSTAATVDLTWDATTQLKITAIECSAANADVGAAATYTVTARTLANTAAPTIQVNDNLAFTMTAANSHLCYTAKATTSPTAAVCAVAGVGTGPTAASDTPVCTDAGTQVGETLIWGDATLTKVSVIECANSGSTAIGIAEEITVTATTRPVVKATFKSISGTGGSEMGSVTIDEGGIISVTMDLTNADQGATPTPNSACYSSGLSWHIHESWSDAANAHGVGSTECGGSNTGGHYDPAFGWYVYIPIRRGRDAHPSVHSP